MNRRFFKKLVVLTVTYAMIVACTRTETATARSQKTGLAFIVETMVLMLTVTGCGKKSASSAATVSGRIALAPVAGATVTAYTTDSSGNPVTQVGSATSDSSGNYTLSLTSIPTTPVVVEATGGSYVDESSGKTVPLTSTINAVAPPASFSQGGTTTMAVSDLTQIAYQDFTKTAASLPSGVTLAQAATNANYQVGQAFGVADPVGTLPAPPTGTIPADTTGQYALALAALSKAASSAATSSGAAVDPVALANSYGSILASTGTINPTAAVSVTNAAGATISFTPPPLTGNNSVNSYMTGIQAGTTTMAGMQGATVPPASQMQPPAFNPIPPTTAPANYQPGDASSTPASAAPQTVTAVSCTVSSVVASCTRTYTVGGTSTTQCTDYVGSSNTTTMVQSTCIGTGSTYSTSACNVVNTSGYTGGTRAGAGTAYDVIQRYYGGYSASQVSQMATTNNPPCQSGT